MSNWGICNGKSALRGRVDSLSVDCKQGPAGRVALLVKGNDMQGIERGNLAQFLNQGVRRIAAVA
jgi:hypothetical protein